MASPSSPKYKYTDIVFDISGQIGTIKFNRPARLNSFGGSLIVDTIAALRELDEHPTTVFTVITGEGRFFSAGADVKAERPRNNDDDTEVVKKLNYVTKFSTGIFAHEAFELLRALVDHRKLLILSLNGPAVGGGAAWFMGVADIILASSTAYLQIPFSALGLVPECGSALSFSQSIGVRRANDVLIFGRKLSVDEMEQWGLVNRVFPVENYQSDVTRFLEEQLDVNDGWSMMESKRQMNAPLRDARMVAVYNSMERLSERFVEGTPARRLEEKKMLLEAKSKTRDSKI